MPLYVPDFLADTMRLSAAETGAYLCLIMDYWMHDGLPDDDRKLAAIARLPLNSWRAMRPTIEAFFQDGWRHKRIDAELEKMVGVMARRHAAAVKAGTMSVIARNRQRDVQRQSNDSFAQRSTSAQRIANHTTKKEITSSSFSTAAREEPTVDNSATATAAPPAVSAEKPAKLAATPELLAILARKNR